MIRTPTDDPSLPRRYADFDTLVDALEYAAQGRRGLNFYNARGELKSVASYRRLQADALKIGAKLVGLGFQPGERIALIAETSPDFVAFFLGCQYARVLPVPLPLPTSFGGKEGYISQLSQQLTSCEANGIMAPPFMQPMIEEAASERDLRFCGSMDSLEDVAATGPVVMPSPDDLSYLQYSSGSTRFPHGVTVTHRSLMSNAHGMSFHGVKMRDDDRVVSWLPFYHDMGLVGTLLTTLASQMSVDFIPTEEFARRPLSWLRVMTENRGSITYAPTFGFDICTRRVSMRKGALDDLDLSSWRVAGCGAEMIRADVLRDFTETFGPCGFSDKAFLASYGLAECTLGVSFTEPGRGLQIDLVEEKLLAGDTHVLVSSSHQETRLREVVNCGIPLPEYDIEIRDENGTPLGDTQVGRIFVRGTSVMQGYYNDPESTRAVLSPDGWLDTGDMGYLRERAIYIVGRAKDMIIVNGRNHWPQDIEWAAEQVDGAKAGDVAAISIPGDHGEEIPVVLVQCRLSKPNERADFVGAIKRHIQQVTGVSCAVELVPPKALPRTSSGKLSRAKARNFYLDGKLQAAAS